MYAEGIATGAATFETEDKANRMETSAARKMVLGTRLQAGSGRVENVRCQSSSAWPSMVNCQT